MSMNNILYMISWMREYQIFVSKPYTKLISEPQVERYIKHDFHRV